MSTERRLASNRTNSESSTGPTTSRGRGHSSRNALKFGAYAQRRYLFPAEMKEFVKLRKKLHESLAPLGGLEEDYVDRLIGIRWTEIRIECAIEFTIEKMAREHLALSPNGSMTDEFLISLIPAVKEAGARMRARAESQPPVAHASNPPDQEPLKIAHIDTAIAEGIAPPGQAGPLSQLREELRKVQRDYDRMLKMFLALKAARLTVDVTPHVAEPAPRIYAIPTRPDDPSGQGHE